MWFGVIGFGQYVMFGSSQASGIATMTLGAWIGIKCSNILNVGFSIVCVWPQGKRQQQRRIVKQLKLKDVCRTNSPPTFNSIFLSSFSCASCSAGCPPCLPSRSCWMPPPWPAMTFLPRPRRLSSSCLRSPWWTTSPSSRRSPWWRSRPA